MTRWLLRLFPYVRQLERDLARHKDYLLNFGRKLTNPPPRASKAAIEDGIAEWLHLNAPAGMAWEVSVKTIGPGFVGVDVREVGVPEGAFRSKGGRA